MAVAIALGTPTPTRSPARAGPSSKSSDRSDTPGSGGSASITSWFRGVRRLLSAWLPKFYTDTYGLSLHTAALLTAVFIFPASLLRPLGGWLSDRHGPRSVTYAVFVVMALTLAILCLPNGNYLGLSYDPGPGIFTAACSSWSPSRWGLARGRFSSTCRTIIPTTSGPWVVWSERGALGGFVLPPIFGWLGRASGVPRLAFGSILALTVVSLVWLHLAVLAVQATEKEKREVALGEVVATPLRLEFPE